MTTEDIRTIALKLPGASEDIKWGNDLCFCIGDKMFAVTGLQPPVTISFKVKDEEFDELCSRNGIIPAPYVAKYKWILVEDIRKVSKKELEHFIRQSYELVKSKLPKKKLRELGLES